MLLITKKFKQGEFLETQRFLLNNTEEEKQMGTADMVTKEYMRENAVFADAFNYLIYNGTIVGQVSRIEELEAKNNLFSEFKAVKNGNVWYTGKNLYQSTDTVGELIQDIHLMLTEENPQDMTFLQKME